MSEDRKRQMIWFQVDDSEAVARHLEKMAWKGWLLESVDNWFYTFRRSEPVEVRYAVTFFPEASIFDPGLIDGQETYVEYCEAAGWELAAVYGPIQYFRTADPDPLPIETDETMKLTAIRRTMGKSFVLSYAALLLLPAVGLPLGWKQFQHDPIAFFCSNRQLANLLIMSGIFLFSGLMLADYLIWLFRSSYAVVRGGRCIRPHTRFRLGLSAVMMGVCACSIVLFLMDPSGARSIFTFHLIVYIGLMILARWVLRKLKASNTERSAILAGYIGFAVVAGLVIGFLTPFLFTRLANAGIIRTGREPVEKYAYCSPDGSFSYLRSVYYDDLPITLEELGYDVRTYDHCSYEETIERSPLAAHSRYTQEPLNFESPLPDLVCQTYDTHWSWLLQKAWENLIEEETGQLDPWPLQKLDPTPWDAVEAYQRAGLTTYFLLYPTRIVVFHLGDDAAAWQLDLIIQALRP